VTPEEEAIQDKLEALRQAERNETQRRDDPTPGVGRSLGCLIAVLMPIIGLVIGGVVGASLAPQSNAPLDLTGLDWPVDGAVIGFSVGLLSALLTVWGWRLLRAEPVPLPLAASTAAVTLTVVGDEMEAETLCGMLRASGIACSFRRTDTSAGIGTYGGGFSMAGPTEVLVDEKDLNAARELLPPR
jgi:Putative prokaryotic signal transducing protein